MGVLVGVGVGPGDPELVTERARRVLRGAGTVFAPSTAPDAVGRAEAIVRQACPGLRIERLVFDMGATGRERADGYAAAAERVVAALDAGPGPNAIPGLRGPNAMPGLRGPNAIVAVAVLGDPNVYSTFSPLAVAVRRLTPEVSIETVPGIMAFQELAARSGTVLVEGTEPLALVTALAGPEAMDGALNGDGGAVVVYKGGRHITALAERLRQAGRLDGAVFGELLGLPGERISAAADVAGDGPATYLSTLIVPPPQRATP